MFPSIFVVIAMALLLSSSVTAQNGKTPCQSVSSMSLAFVSAYPKATAALVPAQAAEDCLKSVPIDKDEDLALLEEMQYYLSWQSNLAYLDTPPKGYVGGRAQIVPQIGQVYSNLQNNKYKDEFTLMTDIQTIITKAYDFHFAFVPDISRVFSFRRGNVGRGLLDEFALVSVSKDGKEIPRLYNYYDVIVGKQQGWTPSPVVLINDKPAEQYVQEWSTRFVYMEDHARYNMLFHSQPQTSAGYSQNQFGRGYRPDGDNTYIKHENGTVLRLVNTAAVPLSAFDDITDGASFFNQFCNLGPPRSNNKRDIKRDIKRHLPQIVEETLRNPTHVKRQKAQASPVNYPAPVMYHSDGVLGGYYLTDAGYTDTAVLSVVSFDPETEGGVQEFQNKSGAFLQAAKAAGKTKLVIDTRGNGGGFVYLGYDLFKQLFPAETPYGASTFRANEAFNEVGIAIDEVFKENKLTYQAALADYNKYGVNSKLAAAWQSIFNWRLPNDVNNKNFTSWKEYFGPHRRHNDDFTTVSRKDLDNFFTDDLNMDVTGYGTRVNALNRNQPFKAENIVILQDGGCGSTCAVFAEFMKTQGNVQQVVVGGLPKTGPMQGVAGSKGSQVYTWTQVFQEGYTAYNMVPQMQADLNKTMLGSLVHAYRPLMRSAYQDSRQTESVINLRDNIRQNDATVTPLEFVYEAADCRLFYTEDMVRNVVNVWKKAADARWKKAADYCVEGSMKHPSSLSGGAQPKTGAVT